MAAKHSAGILLYRERGPVHEVFLVHPGGPFWRNKDEHAWSIPKGEYEHGVEDPSAAALREFEEETGCRLKEETGAEMHPLTPCRQPGGKTVVAWALAGDCHADAVRSNLFSLEWPPRSGRRQEFPEVDRAGWFDLAEARRKILPGQAPFLDELENLLRQATPRQ